MVWPWLTACSICCRCRASGLRRQVLPCLRAEVLPFKEVFWCKLIYSTIQRLTRFSQLRLQLANIEAKDFMQAIQAMRAVQVAVLESRLRTLPELVRGKLSDLDLFTILCHARKTGTGMHSFSWSCMSAAAGLVLSTKAKLQKIQSWILCFALLSPPNALLFLILIFLIFLIFFASLFFFAQLQWSRGQLTWRACSKSSSFSLLQVAQKAIPTEYYGDWAESDTARKTEQHPVGCRSLAASHSFWSELDQYIDNSWS